MTKSEVLHNGSFHFVSQCIRVIDSEIVTARSIAFTTRQFAEDWCQHVSKLSDTKFQLESSVTEAYHR